MGRGGKARRGSGGQVEALTGLRIDLRRVDETVAPHPDLVMRLRQVRHDIPPAFVGDGDLREAGAELRGLRDDPDAGLRAEPAGHDTADIIVVDFNGGCGVLLSARPGCTDR
jgi:hypothetical protein